MQDDTITGSGGNDIISGGDGIDTAVYMNEMPRSYDMTIGNDSIT